MFKITSEVKMDIMQIILPFVYVLIGIIVYTILKNIIDRSINISKITTKAHKQRAETIKMLIILAILSNFGINVKSILTGLGITTAIIGLAFQDLAKDLIAGISIITENQYEVGDTIEVDGFMGEVVFLGLKTTKIRNFKGATKIIANHNMDKIINYSLHDSLALIDVGVSYDNTPEEVEKVLKELITSLNGKIPNVTGDIQILGVQKLADSSVEYRITAPTKPMQHYDVERRLRKEIKNALTKAHINIPYPQVEVHNGK